MHHHGRAIVFAAAAWGVAIACSGSPHDALARAAAASRWPVRRDAISGIFRGAIWNETIPDRLRGRLAGVEMISWSSGPLLGNARGGRAAALVGLRASVVAGGVLWSWRLGGAGRRAPALWNYDARHGATAHPDLIEAVGPAVARGPSPGYGRVAVTDVVVHIEGYPDSDHEERADLTARLRADLLAHDLDAAVQA